MLLAAVSALSGNATVAPRAPTDDELRSTYCVEVLRGEITLQRHLIAASNEAAGVAQPEARAQWIDTSVELQRHLTKLESALHRLQVYLLPRISAIESHALAAAIRQANAEAQDATGNDALLARVRGCENPTWLP